jgi:tetratricopeptide (TPR) repeat protein
MLFPTTLFGIVNFALQGVCIMKNSVKSVGYFILFFLLFVVNNLHAGTVSGVAPSVVQQLKGQYALSDAVTASFIKSLQVLPLIEQPLRFSQLAQQYKQLMQEALPAEVRASVLNGNFANALKQLKQPVSGTPAPQLAKYFYQQALLNELSLKTLQSVAAIKKAVQHGRNNSLYLQQAGEILVHKKQYRPAISYFEQALRVDAGQTQKLANHHYDLGMAWFAIAQGKTALKHLQKSLSLSGGVNQAELYFQLANIVQNLGNNTLAVQHYQKALQLNKARLGNRHPIIAEVLFNFATAQRILGKKQEAMALLKQALSIDRAAYGTSHPVVALRLNAIGTILRTSKQPDKAIKLHQEALKIDQQYQSKGVVIAKDYTHLGQAYLDKKQATQAIDYFSKALVLENKAYGAQHPMLALQYANLAYSWSAQGDVNKTLANFEKALAVTRKNYGEKHHEVASLLRNLGITWQTKGDFKKAASYYQQALSIEQAVYGKTHPMVTRHMDELGYALNRLGQSKTAQTYHQQALQIDKKAYGTKHSDVVRDLSNLGSAVGGQGQYSQAERLHKQALLVGRSVNGGNHPNTARDLDKLSNDLKSQGKVEESLDYQKKSISADKVIYGEKHRDIAVKENNLGVDLYKLGKSDESKQHLSAAASLAQAQSPNANADKIQDNFKTLEENLLIEKQEAEAKAAKEKAKQDKAKKEESEKTTQP